MRQLVACLAPFRVSRVDERTLRTRLERGFFDQEFMRITRGASRPFHAGDEVVLSDMRARLRAVTEDGRPAGVDFTFLLPLEDQSLLWRRLHAGGLLTPWSPPAVGEAVLLPAIAPRPTPRPAEESHRR